VAGDRQASFAARLGYPDPLYGLYAADTELFTAPDNCSAEREFLFAGRLVQEKGIRQLIQGYRRYRERSVCPWRLRIIGAGPYEQEMADTDGIVLEGFVQPNELPDFLASAGCFVLPSRFEPWGVVLHEAASMGLPIIASRECGASTEYTRDGINGYVVSGSAESIADAMRRVSGADSWTYWSFKENSTKLAEMWGPRKWARYVKADAAWYG